MASREPDRGKLRDKLQFIRSHVSFLRSIRDEGRERFLERQTLLYASIRSIQIAVEAMLDAANHIVAREGLGTPKTYREAMDLLVEAGTLPRDKSDSFRKMVGFRNRAVHLYDEIATEEVWKIVDEELGDFEAFVQAITKRYFRSESDD